MSNNNGTVESKLMDLSLELDPERRNGWSEEIDNIIASHNREIEAKNKKIRELLNLLPDCIKCAKYAHGCSCEDGFAAACDKFENKEIAIRDELIQAFCSHLRKWMDYALPISGGMNDEWEEATMLIANARRVLK